MIFIGCILAFLAVVCGAFGAHGLQKILSPDLLDIWKTGAYYHLVHALALVLLGIYEEQKKTRLPLARTGFLAGILLFSGSLYILALTGIRTFGAITPIGGIAFLYAWLAFAWQANQQRSKF